MMPHSYGDFREALFTLLLDCIPDRKTRIIDVGAGDGSLGALAHPYFPNLDAIEIWPPYVSEFDLARKYRYIRIMRAQDIDEHDIRGTVFVLGDVLEHLEVAEAQDLLRRMREGGARMIIVTVPWMYEQPAEHPDVQATGNLYEVHKQPDLTPEIFHKRFPQMTHIQSNTRCGLYTWVGSKPV